MIRKFLYTASIAALLSSSQAYAAKLSQIQAGGAMAPSTDTLVAVRNGTTDTLVTPPTIGSTLTSAGNTLNTTNSLTTLSGTTDPIPSSASGGTVDFTNSSGDAATLVQATTAGFTSGFGFVANNLSTSYSTITPTTSTIGGVSVLSLPPATSCFVYSDGTNYQTALCHALTGIQNVAGSAAGWSNTGNSTSNSICLTNATTPPLGPKDQLVINVLWQRQGTLTDTTRQIVTLGTSSCTPGTTTGVGGTTLSQFDDSTSTHAEVLMSTTVANKGATNSQIMINNAFGGGSTTSGAPSTTAVQTNVGNTIQFQCRTTTSTSDTCGIVWFDIQVIRNP
jgi:hypothetical protein